MNPLEIIPCQWRRGGMICLLALGLVTCAIRAAAAPSGGLEDKQILMLTSYGDGRPGVEAIRDGMMSAFHQAGLSTDQVFIENLDLERAPDPAFSRGLAAALRLKYARRRLDAIYVVEQPALDFLLVDLGGFAPGAPVMAVRANLPAALAGNGHRFVLQDLNYDVAGTLRQALELFPNTKRVLFISGSSASDKAVAAQAGAALQPWRGRVAGENTSGLSLEQIQARIQSPPADSIILVLPLNRDAAGRTAVQMEVAFNVAAAAKAPVFTLWEPVVGRGAVGGSVTRFFGIGQQAGNLLLDLVTGRTALAGAVTSFPTQFVPIYDWKQVERWGGDARRLPAGALVVNRPASLWQHYRRTVIWTGLVLFGQAFLIVLLLVQKRLRRQARAALLESEARFRVLVEQAPEAIVVFDHAGRQVIDANAAAEQLFGQARAQLRESGILRFQAPDQPEAPGAGAAFFENMDRAIRGEPAPFEWSARSADGQERRCEVRLAAMPAGGRPLVRASFIDITERRRAEEEGRRVRREREATVELLRLLNQPTRTRELVALLTQFLQDWTGCAAVGIRLQEGEDFPYCETRGFSPSFVQMESRLCARDSSGELLRDACGQPVLDCMCGNILRGRFDAALPFFTAHGSFWTNSTTELLASTTEAERQARTRNRCNGEGYESVALIPLRGGDQTFGLLQLNDFARGRFTLDLINFLERLSDQIGITLSQRKAQQALKTSERRFRDISEAAGEFLWETDQTGRLTYISDRITEVLGYHPAELIGKRPTDFVLPSQAEAYKPYFAEDFRNLEAPLVARTGQVVWISVTRIRIFNEQGQLTGSRGAGLEITGRKLAEAARRESEARYRSYVDFAPDGVFIADAAGRYVDVNPAACRMTGRSREELLRSGIADLLHPDDLAGGLESFRQVSQTGQSAIDLRYIRGDGTVRWWHVSAVRISPERYLGFTKDITDSRNAAEQILRMNEELERQVKERTASLEATSREMESFSYSVSHDLRAPLRGIDGFSHLLLEEYGERLDPEGRRYLDRIRHGIKHMGELIDDLLKLSRITRCDLDRENIDLTGQAARILETFAQRHPGRAVRTRIAPGLKAAGDTRLVTIALQNLLGNAWKYTQNTPEAQVEFGIMAQDGEEVFFIRDNGAGFDMRYQDKLFIPFQRLHSPQEYEGSGIGLAIVQRVIQRHGGRIWAQSEPGRGATFRFTLPGC